MSSGPSDDERMPRYDEIFLASQEAHTKWREFLRRDHRNPDFQDRRLRWREALRSPSPIVRHQAYEMWVHTLEVIPEHPVLGRTVSVEDGIVEIARSEREPPFDLQALWLRVLLGDETGVVEVRSQLEWATGLRRRSLLRCLEAHDRACRGELRVIPPGGISLFPPGHPPEPRRPPRPPSVALADLRAFRFPTVTANSMIVTAIPVQVGQSVRQGETLLEVESEEAIFEVPSPYDGRLHKWTTTVGAPVECRELICWIEVCSEDAAREGVRDLRD